MICTVAVRFGLVHETNRSVTIKVHYLINLLFVRYTLDSSYLKMLSMMSKHCFFRKATCALFVIYEKIKVSLFNFPPATRSSYWPTTFKLLNI